MKRRVVIVGIASLIIFFIIGAFIFNRNSKSGNLYTVTREALTNTLSVNGTYEVAATANVTTSAKGVITKLYVQNGDSVNKGNPLFYVQSTSTPSEVATAFAAYQVAASAYQEAINTRRAAQATVDNIHDQVKNHSGDETFAQRDSRTTAEVANDSSWDAMKAAEATLKSAQITYLNTQSALTIAPISGKLVNLQNQVGDSVTGDIAMVVDFSNPHITVTVNEVNISKVKVGQTADITFDGLPDRKFSGKVVSMDDVGTLSQGQITYRVVLSIDGDINSIKPKMTANVAIVTLDLVDVLTVPTNGITAKDDKFYVTREDGSMVEIQKGQEGLTKTQVVSGLAEGDKIQVVQ